MAKPALLAKLRPGSPKKTSKRARGAKGAVDVFGILSKARAFARARWRVVVVLGIAATAATYYLLLAPATDRLDAARADVEIQERRSAQLLQQIGELQSSEGATAAANRYDRAQMYDEKLPTSLNQVVLLATLSDEFDEAGLELLEITPVLDVNNLNPTDDPQLGFFAFEFKATGSTSDTAAFVDSIEGLTPLATIHEFSLARQSNAEDDAPMSVSGIIRVWASTAPSLSSFR